MIDMLRQPTLLPLSHDLLDSSRPRSRSLVTFLPLRYSAPASRQLSPSPSSQPFSHIASADLGSDFSTWSFAASRHAYLCLNVVHERSYAMIAEGASVFSS